MRRSRCSPAGGDRRTASRGSGRVPDLAPPRHRAAPTRWARTCAGAHGYAGARVAARRPGGPDDRRRRATASAPRASATSPAPPRASSPTPASASAARRARSRASSGTSCPRTASRCAGDGYDNTGELSATSWRHVKFIEQSVPTRACVSTLDGFELAHDERRLQALRRRRRACEACPDRRHHPHRVRHRLHPAGHLQRLRATASPPARSASSTRCTIDGHAHKCTLCYDRQGDGLVPACAKACPTQSIQFGDLDELRAAADAAPRVLHDRGVTARPAVRRERPRPSPAPAACTRSTSCSTSRRSTGCRRSRSPGRGRLRAAGVGGRRRAPPSSAARRRRRSVAHQGGRA